MGLEEQRHRSQEDGKGQFKPRPQQLLAQSSPYSLQGCCVTSLGGSYYWFALLLNLP